jgi:uncharacterized glyoxalase superfamily protein PhnB
VVDRAGAAIAFYREAFGARVMYCVGDGDDIVAQLSVGGAEFWVTAASSSMKRFSPKEIDGTTSRTLLVVDDPEQVVAHAVAAGATVSPSVGDQHTTGASGGSSIRSATNGKSASLWVRGRRSERSKCGSAGRYECQPWIGFNRSRSQFLALEERRELFAFVSTS